MHGLIAAAGRCTRLQDLSEKRNKALLDLGGESLLDTILNHFHRAGIHDTLVVVGFDAPAVRAACAGRATCLLNPFFEHYGILGSIWQARHLLAGKPFVFTTGDHYFSLSRFQTFLADQPQADVLLDVEIKPCDDEDMKVYLSRSGKLRTMTKTLLDGTVLGEFTATVRCSAEGSTQFFDTFEKYVWQHGIQGYLADVLCAVPPQVGTGVSSQHGPWPGGGRFPLRPRQGPTALSRTPLGTQKDRVSSQSVVPRAGAWSPDHAPARGTADHGPLTTHPLRNRGHESRLHSLPRGRYAPSRLGTAVPLPDIRGGPAAAPAADLLPVAARAALPGAAIKRGGNEWLEADSRGRLPPRTSTETIQEIRRLQPAAVIVDAAEANEEYLREPWPPSVRWSSRWITWRPPLPLAADHQSAARPAPRVLRVRSRHAAAAGQRYALVRPEMRRVRPIRAQEPPQPFRAMVALGDDDPNARRGELAQLLLNIAKLDRVDVVVRPQHPAAGAVPAAGRAHPTGWKWPSSRPR